ncbi:MAG: ATP-binding cassette domain-containing protein [Solirubrobacteraceae bacterium]
MPAELADSEARPIGVRCEGLVKWFGGVQALSGVSLSIRAGEVVAVVGDNGAGKSTLVKILSGIHRPDGGEIWLGEEKLDHLTPPMARTFGIETVYQDLALCDNLDAISNVVLGQEPVRFKLGPVAFLNKRAATSLAKQRLKEVGIRIQNFNVSVHRLSGGQRQAIAIARGMMYARRLMLLDEPTAALGVRETKGTLDVIRSVAAQGIGVLVISHSIDDVFAIADRIVVLRLGRVVFDGATHSTNPDQIVGHITGGIMGSVR